jgi:hypothetical protein
VRRDAAFEKAGDPMRDDACLPGSGTGEDEERSVLVLDGLSLGRVHRVLCCYCHERTSIQHGFRSAKRDMLERL